MPSAFHAICLQNQLHNLLESLRSVHYLKLGNNDSLNGPAIAMDSGSGFLLATTRSLSPSAEGSKKASDKV